MNKKLTSEELDFVQETNVGRRGVATEAAAWEAIPLQADGYK